MIIIIYIYFLTFFAPTSAFKSQIYRYPSNLLIYNSSTGLNQQLFNNQPQTKICSPSNQFFTSFEQTLSIRSRQGSFNVEAYSNTRQVLITGISTSKYNLELDQYESKIKILTRCIIEQTSFITYTLILKLISSNETTIIEVPVGLSCFPNIYNIRVQYIILQFLIGLIFIIFLIMFSNLTVTTFKTSYQYLYIALFLLLPVIQIRYLFPLFISYTFLYKLCFEYLTIVRIVKLSIGACFITLGIVWLEMNFSLYIHYLFNFMTLYVGLVIFKLKRFRHVVVMLVIGVFLLSYYKEMIRNNVEIEIILPALFKNQKYSCVYFCVWDILYPLMLSGFIARSYNNYTAIKNIHVLIHFVSFLGLGLFEALQKMGGVEAKSMVETILVIIVVSSVGVSLVQGNMQRMVTFKERS